jgi:outer membrane lipoprotein-sorting protein
MRWLKFVVVLLFCSTSFAQAIDTKTILQRIRENYPEGKAVKAEYIRKTTTKIGAVMGEGQEESASGEIFFSAPNKLRLEQSTPQKEVLVTDGHKIYWHILSKDEVYIYDFKSQGESVQTIVNVFQGMKGMETEFKIESKAEDKSYKLQITPLNPQGEFSSILLTLDEKFRVSKIAIKTISGSITEFYLKGQQIIPPPFDGYFQFAIPEGVKVIKEAQ